MTFRPAASVLTRWWAGVRTTGMRVAVAPALAVVAVASGCGRGGDSNSGAAKRTIAPDAQAQAKAINLRLSDFPDGCRASTPEEDTTGQSKFRKCIGADYSNVTHVRVRLDLAGSLSLFAAAPRPRALG
jgi:hypothetical protein